MEIGHFGGAAPQFTVTSACTLSSLSLVLGGGGYTLTLTVDEDNFPSLDQILEKWTLNVGGREDLPNLVTVYGNSTDLMVPGVTYDVAVQPIGDNEGSWFFNDIGADDPFLVGYRGAWAPTSGPSPVLEIQVNPHAPVPEPNAALTLGLVSLGLIVRKRRA